MLVVHTVQAENPLAAIEYACAEVKIGKGPLCYMERDLQEGLEELESAWRLFAREGSKPGTDQWTSLMKSEKIHQIALAQS